MHREIAIISRMTDKDRADRLRKARKLRYEDIRAAADALGVKYPTYAGHENGSKGMKPDVVTRYAAFFRVNLEWLMNGKGPMRGSASDDEFVKAYTALSPTQQRVVDLVMAALQQADPLEAPSSDEEPGAEREDAAPARTARQRQL